MQEIIDLLNKIQFLDCLDPNAQEKLTLYWRTLYLLEQNMSREEKSKLSLICSDELMNHPFFAYDFLEPSLAKTKEETILEMAIKEAKLLLVHEKKINNDKTDTYLNLCRISSIFINSILKRLGYSAITLHTTDFGISKIPHFFVIVNFENTKYLVDITFRQFMLVPFCIDERIYHCKYHFVSPATFEESNFFIELASTGYVKLNPNVLDTYLTAFKKAELSAQVQNLEELKRIRNLNLSQKGCWNRLEGLSENISDSRVCSFL